VESAKLSSKSGVAEDSSLRECDTLKSRASLRVPEELRLRMVQKLSFATKTPI